ncbi:MAG: zinc-ribbon domain-containing protein [Lachnospiraceae bacterium]|nr:zinc-ribbon domain-containing protein [Lachnospiraceae bacterium]
MSTLGNIIWFIFGGWWNFLLYGFLGILFSITIIGIPIGKALFQYAKLMVFPFGKVIIKETELKGKENVAAVRRVGGVIANLIWLPVGIFMFIGNVLLAVASAITIIGIPVAIVLVRSAKFLIWPVGAKVITKDQAEMLRMEKSMMKVMGTAMAVNQSMMAQPTAQARPEQNAIPQQTGSFGPAGSQTADISGTGAGSGAASKAGLTMESVVEKSERVVEGLRHKVLQNQVIAKLMPYLDFVALGVLVLNTIGVFLFGGILGVILWLLVIAVTGLEIIKGNRLMVLILLGVSNVLGLIGLTVMFRASIIYRAGIYFITNTISYIFSFIFSFIFLLFLIAALVWYILVFVKGKGPLIQFTDGSVTFTDGFLIQKPSAGGNGSADTASESSAGTQTTSGGKRFCSQCGTEYSVGARFCPKCGAKTPE